jgi:hypothetical protein
MTVEQCRTCAKPTAHCRDPQYRFLEAADCLDYTALEKEVKP